MFFNLNPSLLLSFPLSDSVCDIFPPLLTLASPGANPSHPQLTHPLRAASTTSLLHTTTRQLEPFSFFLCDFEMVLIIVVLLRMSTIGEPDRGELERGPSDQNEPAVTRIAQGLIFSLFH